MDTSLITDKLSDAADKLSDIFDGPLLEVDENTNVSKSERILSLGAGSFIFFRGITNLFSSPLLAVGEIAIGAFLVQRGVSGQCKLKPLIDNSGEYETETVAVVSTYP